MHYIAPIVLLLGLSGALYKTQEVYPLAEYKAMEKPYFVAQMRAMQGRIKFGTQLQQQAKAKASASGGGGG